MRWKTRLLPGQSKDGRILGRIAEIDHPGGGRRVIVYVNDWISREKLMGDNYNFLPGEIIVVDQEIFR